MANSNYITHLLEHQADQIELVLAGHRLPGQIVGGSVTPRWIRYHLLPEVTVKLSRVVAISEEIALRLGAASVRVARQGAAVQIEVPRADGQSVSLRQLTGSLARLPRQTALLGLDENGLPLLLRLASPEVAHVLVAGATGSGKTALLRSIALSLAMYNRLGDVQLLFIDPKRNSFSALAAPHSLPHLLRPVVDDVHQAIFLLGEMVTEMMRRDRERIVEPRLIIFIDELADLMEQGGRAMERLMTRLSQRGRSAGLHLVACTQKPLAAAIGSLTRSNFPVRLVGSVTSADDARLAAGLPGTGAEKLLGRGDFLLVNKGQVLRFQAAYASTAEIRQMTAALTRQYGGNHRPTLPTPEREAVPLAATGTSGRSVTTRRQSKSRWQTVLGQQLRLLK